jgi:hypothetical protein
MFPSIQVWIFRPLAINILRMIDPDDQEPYRIEPDGGRFKVVDWEGAVVLICGDEPSAGQYAALMNQAYRRGFKAGIRKARKPS